MRLCGDYSVRVNKHLKNLTYPLLRIEKILSKLHKGKTFSKLDHASAYNQFEVDKKSRNIACISTIKGFYLMNRLPFGIGWYVTI